MAIISTNKNYSEMERLIYCEKYDSAEVTGVVPLLLCLVCLLFVTEAVEGERGENGSTGKGPSAAEHVSTSFCYS